MGVWSAARTSDCRLCACCVMECWLACWCGMQRPMVGTQIMAELQGGSLRLHPPIGFENHKLPAFPGIWDCCHEFRQCSLPFRIYRSYFRLRAGL